ncbi:helix-turn-helix domain-containing protein, partial [Nonomuraea sp. NN258]|uniref:helix-turn-helix domain-containing protein n=1 Tax=Nonomuraea antri TaxID=2730852 RepID=UPI0015694937
ALGWAVRGPVTGYLVRPVGERPDAARAQELITATLGQVPVLRRGEGWAGWSALPPVELAERLRRCVETMPWPCAAGVGAAVADLASMGDSLLGAEAAAFVAGAGTVARADRMGPAELLGALPAGVLRAPAAVVLRPLLAIDKDGTLLETLAAVLDEGGALKAADRLGVHRNTVTTRLDRIKSAGFDLDDPANRLALQLACHVLLR